MEGGHAKRAVQERQKRLTGKHEEDIGRMKFLPSLARLQDGILRVFVSLKRVENLFQNHSPPLPVRVRGGANTCIVGATWCDMFGRRKSEWQSLKLRRVQAMLAADTDFLTFKQHKTSRTYGTLAKWVSPGARQALKSHIRLPREPHVDTFLCTRDGRDRRCGHSFGTEDLQQAPPAQRPRAADSKPHAEVLPQDHHKNDRNRRKVE